MPIPSDHSASFLDGQPQAPRPSLPPGLPPGLPPDPLSELLIQRPQGEPEIAITPLSGKPEIGIIHSVGQIHCIYKETVEQYKAIGRYQWEILKYLQSNQFKHIFVEGVVNTWTMQSPSERLASSDFHFLKLIKPVQLRELLSSPEEMVDNVKELFSPATHQPNDDQLLCLGNLGAYFVYACLNPQVTIHRAVSPGKDNRLVSIQKKLETSVSADPIEPTQMDESNNRSWDKLHYERFFPLLRDRFREDYLMDEISEFLRKNPGQTVCVIFGIHHKMEDARDRHFSHNHQPEMNVISFPRAQQMWRESYVKNQFE